MQLKEIVTFFFEMGQLSRVKREGWRLLGVEQPESVADHSLRAAQIGWILAKLEGYNDPNEVATMLVFHDISECRVGDLHKVAARYVIADETKAVQDQLSRLGTDGDQIFSLWHQIEEKSTQAGIIAKDADLIEMAVRACEYMALGIKAASEWFDSAALRVRTESAKRLLDALREVSPTAWWDGVKKIEG
jgi:putative hydrolase of HD superfamily